MRIFVTGGSDKLFTNAVHTPPSSKRLMKQGSDDIASYLRDDGCFYRELPCRSRLQLIYGASSVVSAPTRIFIVLQRAITLRANTNIRWNTCGLRSRRSVSSAIRATLAPPPPIPVLRSRNRRALTTSSSVVSFGSNFVAKKARERGRVEGDGLARHWRSIAIGDSEECAWPLPPPGLSVVWRQLDKASRRARCQRQQVVLSLLASWR